MSLIIPASQTLADTGFSIDNSCRFNDNDTAYLARTPGSDGNRRTWTLSFWVKRGNLHATVVEAGYYLFCCGADDARIMFTEDSGGDTFNVVHGGSTTMSLLTTPQYRDTSAWYHFVVAMDTTQSVEANRCKIYINGVQELNLVTSNYPSQNDDLNWNKASSEFGIGRSSQYTSRLFDGYLAEVHWVDGTALDQDSFGESGDYGEWKPIKYTGSHGTYGFYLDFADSADLGDDESGNGNDFTENGIAAHDQMTDTPTNNFCTMNPLNTDSGVTLSEGSLKWVSSSHDQATASTMAVPSTGKFYWEVYVANESGTHANVGIVSAEQVGTLNVGDVSSFNAFAQSGHRIYIDSGYKAGSTAAASNTAYGASWTTGDIIGVAVDMDAPSLTFYKNNASQGASHTDISLQTWIPLFATYSPSSSTYVANFGQDGTFAGNKTAQGNADGNGYGNFYYAPPSSHLALCSQNLPDPTVTPSEHFNTILYDDGAGAKTGVGFQPDLVWFKSRGSTYSHKLTDAVRGVTKAILKPNSAVEATDSTGLTAFGADGFTVGADTTYSDTTGDGMVAWNWKANGSGSSNGTGSVTSTVSANTSAGFSIVSWVGTGATATIGHGLSQTPNFITVKNREGTHNQVAGTIQSSVIDFTDGIFPDWIDAMNDNADYFSDTPPTSSVFTVGSSVNLNQSTDNMIAYCWHSVEGYSKIGYYIGNGNADGPFIYTGFTPAWFFIKQITVAGQWRVYDNKRGDVVGGNPNDRCLYFDTTAVEAGENDHDLLSNGIKVRNNGGEGNTSTRSYLYMAFAENPFKYTNAR